MIKVSIVLVIFTSLLPLVNVSAQKSSTVQFVYPESGAPIELRDSVKIHRDSLYYETGERMSTWVYDKIHKVRQIGSKYHPTGVLVDNIYSWIPVGAILPMSESKKAVPEPVYTTINETIDYGKTYTWNGVEYKAAGSYEQKFVAVSGVDSIVTLNLTILPPPTVYTTLVDTVGYGESYTWNNETYSASGKYVQTFAAATGADSVVTLHLTVLKERKPVPYQVNRFTIGVRGGFASSMAKPAKLPVGYDVLLDLQYAHYWAADQDKIRLGLLTGLSAGYMNTQRSQAWDEVFTSNTTDGDVIYHVTADNIKETSHQLQLEVPLMFSMITNGGFFLNVGPRFLLPAYTPYKQTITNGNIVATDVETGVVLENNPVYGVLSEEQINQKGDGDQQFKLTLTLGLELGYEFKLKSGNSIGLGAFANYGLYSMYSNIPLGSAIDVTAPSTSGAGIVDVESLTNAYTSKMGHLDAGIKVTYNLDFIK